MDRHLAVHDLGHTTHVTHTIHTTTTRFMSHNHVVPSRTTKFLSLWTHLNSSRFFSTIFTGMCLGTLYIPLPDLAPSSYLLSVCELSSEAGRAIIFIWMEKGKWLSNTSPESKNLLVSRRENKKIRDKSRAPLVFSWGEEEE